MVLGLVGRLLSIVPAKRAVFSACEQSQQRAREHTTLRRRAPAGSQRKTKRQMSTDTKRFPGWCDSAEEATWGEDWSILWQQSGKVQGFVFVCGRRVDFWSLFMQPPPPPPLPAAHLGKETRSLQYGRGLAEASPCQPSGLQQGPGAHAGCVC